MSSLRYPPAGEFIPADITSHNLNQLDDTFSGDLDARRGHLRELALSISESCEGTDDLLEVLAGFGTGIPFTPRTIPENADFLRAGFNGLTLLEQTELCKMLAQFSRPTMKSADFFPPDEPIPLIARGTIAYLQNTYTDRAFQIFSAGIPRSRAQYHDSYPSICEAVSSGSCEACILPVEHAHDGKLNGFYRLIDRYDLKIACTCSLSQGDNVESRFALLKKNISSTLPRQRNGCCFELSITPGSGTSIAALLNAAELCSLHLRRVDTLPMEYADDEFVFHIVLTADDHMDFLPFLLFLTLKMPQYNPIGIFPHISE